VLRPSSLCFQVGRKRPRDPGNPYQQQFIHGYSVLLKSVLGLMCKIGTV